MFSEKWLQLGAKQALWEQKNGSLFYKPHFSESYKGQLLQKRSWSGFGENIFWVGFAKNEARGETFAKKIALRCEKSFWCLRDSFAQKRVL